MSTYSTRADDVKVEQAIARYLDKNFYPRLNKPFERCNDRLRQFAGCDVQLSGYTVMNIDEKVKYKNCTNQILEYPSFEMQYIDRGGNEHIGWFMDKKNVTDYYAFIAVFLKHGAYIEHDNIDMLNVLLVKKQDIKDFIDKYDSEADLWDGVQKLRDDDVECRFRFGCGYYWLKKSTQFAEAPINLVTTRSILKTLKNTREIEVTSTTIRKI